MTMTTASEPRRVQLLIGGEWVAGEGGEPLALTSPATGERIALVEQGTATDVDRAVAGAQRALEPLRRMTAFERAALCHRVADALLSRREQIARDLSLEQGKVYATEALGEVDTAAAMYRDAGECATRLESSVYQSSEARKRVFTIRQPRGVYGVITPWNFPLAIPSEYLSAGLATGNAIVWKPSEWTPLSAVHLMRAFLDAGVPDGTLNLLLGAPATVGGTLASHPGVAAIGLTGSTRTGDAVAGAAAGKPLLLELGGNGPTIVFADADLDRAAAQAAMGSFANAGQICNSTERILVQRSAHDAFVERLLAAARDVRLGSPLADGTTMGPLTNEPTAAKVDAHVADAVAQGAEILQGGGRAGDLPTRLYYEPTVIVGVHERMLLNREETFGPVAPVLTFEDEADALRLAATCRLGLNGSLWTRDLSRALRVAERLGTGTVNVNETSAYWQPHTPVGGFTGSGSGIGRLGGMQTLLEMTQLKTITIDVEEAP
ncbi:aldehyde dehydrogenase family protein [Conexibacter woesei]|uniref:Aldehyde Dehydrogenase n=1 Tax=Conexibacter woesei (strain DSM 14684 / CCUG 47730 / CIP 108061 / JCM 11494 / NBRC 100937 / ID131577) TaxID=469383 RepID=D3FEK2_CONWI|nr:aldehyde dehydrogenase family protein [Conexibacter woesei]ADB49676.1 Aldehyde Dehydrogenase [Conexibacter woesei DSM 14684]